MNIASAAPTPAPDLPPLREVFNVPQQLQLLTESFVIYPNAPWALLIPYIFSIAGVSIAVFAYKMWPFK